MIKQKFSYLLLLLLTISCSSEKINLSPIGENIIDSSGKRVSYTMSEKKNIIFYSSALTNLIATFPKFKNDAVNKEVSYLKIHLKDYIGAIQEYNEKGMAASEKKYEKSYKKLQKLRKFLSKQDDEILNRYLVKIKINMSLLNGNLPKDSISII